MNFIDKIKARLRRKRINKHILMIAIIIRDIEEKNTNIVKDKLVLFKEIKEDEEAIKELILDTEWQKETFELLSDMSYEINKFTKGFKTTPLINDLKEKIIEGRTLIDSLVNIFDSQLNLLKSVIAPEIKQKNLRTFFDEEFSFYKQYQSMKESVSQEAMAEIEVEWEEKLPQFRHGRYTPLQKKFVIPLLSMILLGIIYLSIDDPEVKKIMSDPSYLIFFGVTTVATTKILVSLRKFRKGLKKIDKKPKD
jgi:hypothetical protein